MRPGPSQSDRGFDRKVRRALTGGSEGSDDFPPNRYIGTPTPQPADSKEAPEAPETALARGAVYASAAAAFAAVACAAAAAAFLCADGGAVAALAAVAAVADFYLKFLFFLS